jgi:probable HAF family extracellular repeat protein
MRDLGTLGGSKSDAIAINERGQIVGVSEVKYPRSHAFLWQNGKMTDLGALRAQDQFAEPRGINARGQIIGESALCNARSVDLDTECHPRAVLWTLKP